MREPHFDGLRTYADDAVRQPDFAASGSGRSGCAAVGVTPSRRAPRPWSSRCSRPVSATPARAVRKGDFRRRPPAPPPDVGWPRVTSVVATGSDGLYAVYRALPGLRPGAVRLGRRRRAPGSVVPCRPGRRTPASPRTAVIVSLGRDALGWRDLRPVRMVEVRPSGPPQASPTQPMYVPESPPPPTPPWTTVDGGRTWRRAVIDPEPVAAVPPGTRPVSCHFVGQPSPCRIHAVDPVTGRFAPLANQPAGIMPEEAWSRPTDRPARRPPVGARAGSGLPQARRRVQHRRRPDLAHACVLRRCAGRGASRGGPPGCTCRAWRPARAAPRTR